MKISQQTWLSILRTLLTLGGTFFIGKNIANHAITDEIWTTLGGVAATVFSIVWGIKDKSAGIEQIESLTRSALTALSGIVVGWGLIKNEVAAELLGLINPIFTIIQSYTSKAKVVQMDNGTVMPDPKKVGLVMKNTKVS